MDYTQLLNNDVEAVSRHLQRSSNPAFLALKEALHEMRESTLPLDFICQKAADARKLVMVDKPRLSEVVRLTHAIKSKLSEQEAGTVGPLLSGKPLTDSHEQFIHKLEQKLQIVVERWEPVSNGVYVYLDRVNTRLALSKINNVHSAYEFLASLGYVLLRRGTIEDIEFGSFGEQVSKWIFVCMPVNGSSIKTHENVAKSIRAVL